MCFSQVPVDFERFQNGIAADGDGLTGTVESEDGSFPPAFRGTDIRAREAGINSDCLSKQLAAAENLVRRLSARLRTGAIRH